MANHMAGHMAESKIFQFFALTFSSRLRVTNCYGLSIIVLFGILKYRLASRASAVLENHAMVDLGDENREHSTGSMPELNRSLFGTNSSGSGFCQMYPLLKKLKGAVIGSPKQKSM